MRVPTPLLDETHDPSCVSWVESANASDTDFPLVNLPFGVFRHDYEERPRVGIAIGDRVLDCLAAMRAGLFGALDPAVRDALASWTLTPLMALGRGDARDARRVVHRLLRADTTEGARARELAADILASPDAIGMRVPAEIGDFTQFDGSGASASMPVGANGRASSIVANGTPVRRPRGHAVSGAEGVPQVVPGEGVTFAFAVGAYVAHGTRQGDVVALSRAEDFLFGLCLVTDWSARDPLGPSRSRSFATTASPWVVTLDALEPFRTPAFARPIGDQALLPYLSAAGDRARGGLGIALEAWLGTAAMREQGLPPQRVRQGDLGTMPWTFAQMLAYQASNGCRVRPGDLIASRMASGATHGTDVLLHDGDEVTLRAWCARDGFRRIGFGECRGALLPALA